MFLNHYVSLRVNNFINSQFRLIIYYSPSSGGSRISPRWGRQPSGVGHQHRILPNFPKNCMKLKEFGARGPSLSPPPLRSATAFWV